MIYRKRQGAAFVSGGGCSLHRPRENAPTHINDSAPTTLVKDVVVMKRENLQWTGYAAPNTPRPWKPWVVARVEYSNMPLEYPTNILKIRYEYSVATQEASLGQSVYISCKWPLLPHS